MSAKAVPERSSQASYMEFLCQSVRDIPWKKVFVITLIAGLILLPMIVPLAAVAKPSCEEESCLTDRLSLAEELPLTEDVSALAPMCRLPDPFSEQCPLDSTRFEPIELAEREVPAWARPYPQSSVDSQQQLKEIEYFEDFRPRYYRLKPDEIAYLTEIGLDASTLKLLFSKGMSMHRVLGISRGLFPELHGEALVRQLWPMFPGKQLFQYYDDVIDPNGCFIHSPSNPYALFLSSTYDPNGAFNERRGSMHTLLSQLTRVYNTCWRRFSNLTHAVEKAGALPEYDLMVLGMHGTPKSASVGYQRFGLGPESITVEDPIPKELFRNLKADGTLLLHSCSTGKGRESEYNLANHIARHVPLGVTTIAPEEDLTYATVTSFDPLEITMSGSFDLSDLGPDMSYRALDSRSEG